MVSFNNNNLPREELHTNYQTTQKAAQKSSNHPIWNFKTLFTIKHLTKTWLYFLKKQVFYQPKTEIFSYIHNISEHDLPRQY